MPAKNRKTSKKTKAKNNKGSWASLVAQNKIALFVVIFAVAGTVVLANSFAASPKMTGSVSITSTSTDGKIHWGSPVKVNWTMTQLPKSKYVYLGIVCPEISPTDMTHINGGADWNASYYPGNQASPWNTVMGWDASHSSQLNANGTASFYYYSNYTPAQVAVKTDNCSVGLLVGGAGPSTLVAKTLFQVIP